MWSEIVRSHLINYPTNTSGSYFYSLGFVLGFFFAMQIFTGLMLSVHYVADVTGAFSSVYGNIYREVNFGWLIKDMHLNGAAFLFILMYLHIARGLFMKSYILKRAAV